MQRMKQQFKGQAGITGLETAIILIAFVVVASVFAYTVLSAGIFSSEKSKEAIYEGLEGARSSLELVGGIIAEDSDSDNDIDVLRFVVTNALNGDAIDLATTADSNSNRDLSDESTQSHTTIVRVLDDTTRYDNVAWTKNQLGKGDGDDLLEAGERFQITVNIPTGMTIGAYEQFTVEMRPDTGSSLIFERTLPGKIDSIMDLN